MNDLSRQILENLDDLGFQASIKSGKISITPSNVPRELLELISKNSVAFRKFLEQRQASLDVLRLTREDLIKIMPRFGQTVELPGNQEGRLWGISPRGILIETSPNGIIRAFSFAELSFRGGDKGEL
jgi:hypothetical protein